MRLFQLSKIQSIEDFPLTAQFNEASLTFLVPVGPTLTVYDAITGHVVNAFYDVCNSAVTSVCFDNREVCRFTTEHCGLLECVV
jgi:hypothetical protein